MPEETVPKSEHHGVRADEGARVQQAERQERRPVAGLDQREGAEQHRRGREQEDRLRAAPARVRALDDGVHEQDERPGHGEGAGRVVAAARDGCLPALAQEHGAEHQGHPPMGTLMKKIHSQPGPSTSGPAIR